MTANLQRALRLLLTGYARVQWAGGGSPQGTGLWSLRGDDGGGGGDGSGGGSDGGGGGGGGGGGADGLLRVSSTGPTEAERAPEQQHAAPREWRRRAQWRAERPRCCRRRARANSINGTRTTDPGVRGAVLLLSNVRNTLREKGEQLPQHLKVFISKF